MRARTWGVWCKDTDDWLREPHSIPKDVAILAFDSKKAAQRRAARNYGFPSYREARKKDWCEVRRLP
jgi:hypothetical protein